MNRRFLKSLWMIPAFMLASLSLVTTASNADMPLKSSALSNTAAVQASAKFTQAASIRVKHDSFQVPTIRSFMPVAYAIEKRASIQINGISGETVVVSCQIESVEGPHRYTDNSNVNQLDCNGGNKIEQQAVLSGSTIDRTVLLTSDMAPSQGIVSDSNVTIDIFYI